MGDSINPDRHTERGKGHGNAGNYAATTQKAIRHGKPLPPVAVDTRNEIAIRYAEVGAAGMIQDAALDAELVCELYLHACVQAADLGQRPRFHEACRTWGYLRNSATKHWQIVGDTERAEANILDLSEAVSAARDAKD